MSKLLAVDLDGTLFYPKKITRCISKKNCKFLQRWYDAGNRIVLITSRSRDYLERLKDEIKRPFDFITSGSAQIGVDGELIRDVPIQREGLYEILNQIEKEYKPVAYLMTAKDNPLLIKNCNAQGKILLAFYKLYWIFQFKYRETYILENNHFDEVVKNGDCYKVMVFYGFNKKNNERAKLANKVFRDKYPEIESSWSYIVNEFTPRDCHKGIGLEIYTKHLNIDKKDVYVVGDSGNDIEMFNKFPENSYCMKHGGAVVAKYAKHVIRRVYDLDKIVLKGETNE